MCQMCNKHGDGKTWYLESKFYDEEMEKEGRREFWLRIVYERFESLFSKSMRYLGFVKAIPLIGEAIEAIVEELLRREHYGQVIPLDDLPKVFELATSIYRHPCVCKMVMLGKMDENHCLGFGMFPENYFKAYADYSPHTVKIDKDEAMELVTELEKKGHIHSIWTYRTPYVGKLCNCDLPNCAGFTTQKNFSTQVLYKSEYLFTIDEEKCNGCKNCKKYCPFGAIEYSPVQDICIIDRVKCFGCGICRRGCKKEAILMKERPPFLHKRIEEYKPQRFHYKILVDKEKCQDPLACRKCMELCPQNVFLTYPLINRQDGQKAENWVIDPSYHIFCIGCMECVDLCPNQAISIHK